MAVTAVSAARVLVEASRPTTPATQVATAATAVQVVREASRPQVDVAATPGLAGQAVQVVPADINPVSTVLGEAARGVLAATLDKPVLAAPECSQVPVVWVPTAIPEESEATAEEHRAAPMGRVALAGRADLAACQAA